MANAKRAFIFDMDGTIVDNMAFHTKSWITFFERRGHAIDPDAFFRATAGRQGGEELVDRRVGTPTLVRLGGGGWRPTLPGGVTRRARGEPKADHGQDRGHSLHPILLHLYPMGVCSTDGNPRS